jgi:hypothetical protein
MSSAGGDLEAQISELRGEAAGCRGIAAVMREQAAATHRAADDYERKARRKDAKADRLTGRLVMLAAVDARNEERFRMAAAVPAEEES